MPTPAAYRSSPFQLLIFLLLLYAPVRSTAQETIPAELPTDTLQQILHHHAVPGAAVLTFTATGILQEHYSGLADLATARPVDAQTPFCVGSIAKSVLAAAVLQAEGEGHLSLHQPLSELLPDLRYHNPWAATSPVTVAHLLEHTSGFDDAHFDLEARADARTPLAEVAALSEASLTTQWEPGTAAVYNNLGAMLAAHALEAATGTDFKGYVAQHVFGPAGMHTATYRPQQTELATGYRGDGEVVPFPDVAQWPVGALSMTGRDLSRFVRLLLNDGLLDGRAILPPGTVADLQRSDTYYGAAYGLQYGYGKGLIHRLENNHPFVGHSGQYGGFQAEFGYSEALDFGYLILLNHREGAGAIAEIKRRLIPVAEEVAVTNYVPEESYVDALTGAYLPVGAPLGLLYPIVRLADIQLLHNREGQLVQRSMVGGERPLEFVNKHVLREAGQAVGTGLAVAEYGRLRSDGTDYRKIGKVAAYLQFWGAAFCGLVWVLGLLIVPVQLLVARYRRSPITCPLLIAFLPIALLVVALGQLVFLYNTTVLYSAGAVLYFGLSVLFALATGVSVVSSLRMVWKSSFGRLFKVELLVLAGVSVTVLGYLLYWGWIGLRLWGYV